MPKGALTQDKSIGMMSVTAFQQPMPTTTHNEEIDETLWNQGILCIVNIQNNPMGIILGSRTNQGNASLLLLTARPENEGIPKNVRLI